MPPQFGVHLAVVVLTLAAVIAVVGLHYEGLNWLARWLARSSGPRRPRVLRAVIGVMALHIAEIWIFGGCYWLALAMPKAGSIGGVPRPRNKLATQCLRDRACRAGDHGFRRCFPRGRSRQFCSISR